MHDKNGDIHKRYEQDEPQAEKIIRKVKALHAEYLQGNFWPACGTAGGLLLFLAASVIVPP
jgi:hypothetical protein